MLIEFDGFIIQFGHLHHEILNFLWDILLLLLCNTNGFEPIIMKSDFSSPSEPLIAPKLRANDSLNSIKITQKEFSKKTYY
jgi:hypothetical protein